MNCKRIYAEFIQDRINKQPVKPEYFEVHHILPKSFGGSDDPYNLIKLSAEDHFFAHLLLAKAYGGAMWYALQGMLLASDGRALCKHYLRRARRYIASIREQAAIIHSSKMKGRFTGEVHPMWGKPCSELAKQKTRERHAAGFNPMASPEARKKVSQALKGRKYSDETIQKMSAARMGMKRTEESKDKQSKTMTGRKIPQVSIEKTRAALTGKKKSVEHIDNMRKANLGKTLTNETKKKISDAWKSKGHPKGMLGKSHSKECKQRMVRINVSKREYALRFGVSARTVTLKMLGDAQMSIL